jgi:hypothetical protein
MSSPLNRDLYSLLAGMADRFTDHLASRLGISEDDARQMLAVFNGYLFEELERSGAAVIPDVGTFSRENGTTVFEADSALASLVNARNTGLDELAASRRGLLASEADEAAEVGAQEFDEVEADAEPFEEDQSDEHLSRVGFVPVEEPVVDPEEAAEHEGTQPETDAEEELDDDAPPLLIPTNEGEERPDKDDVLEADDFEQDQWEEEAAPAAEITASTIDPSLTDSENEAATESADDLDALIAAAYDEEEPTESEADVPAVHDADAIRLETEDVVQGDSDMNVPPQDRPPVPPDRKRSGVPWLMIGVIVIIVGIVGLVALFITGDRDEPRRPAVSEVIPQTDGDFAADDPDSDEGFEGDDLDDGMPADEPAPEPPPPPTAATGDPLFGDSIDRTQSRYTLVIASLPSQGAAETVMNSWRNRGFRAAVFSETIDGVTRYRVGVGQFDTIANADAARSEGNVAADLPEGTWVYRYPASTSN